MNSYHCEHAVKRTHLPRHPERLSAREQALTRRQQPLQRAAEALRLREAEQRDWDVGACRPGVGRGQPRASFPVSSPWTARLEAELDLINARMEQWVAYVKGNADVYVR